MRKPYSTFWNWTVYIVRFCNLLQTVLLCSQKFITLLPVSEHRQILGQQSWASGCRSLQENNFLPVVRYGFQRNCSMVFSLVSGTITRHSPAAKYSLHSGSYKAWWKFLNDIQMFCKRHFLFGAFCRKAGSLSDNSFFQLTLKHPLPWFWCLSMWTLGPIVTVRGEQQFVRRMLHWFERFCDRKIKNKTGTSQVGAISKAQIKSKGGPFGDKKIREKVAQCRKSRMGGPFTLIRICRLRLKSKKPKGDLLE